MEPPGPTTSLAGRRRLGRRREDERLASRMAVAVPEAKSSTPMAGLEMVPTRPHPRPVKKLGGGKESCFHY